MNKLSKVNKDPILVGNLKPAPEPTVEVQPDFPFDRLLLAPSMMVLKKPKIKSKIIVVNKELDTSHLFPVIVIGRECAEYTGLEVGDLVALDKGNYTSTELWQDGQLQEFVFVYGTSMFYALKGSEPIVSPKLEETSKAIDDPNIESPLLDHTRTDFGTGLE